MSKEKRLESDGAMLVRSEIAGSDLTVLCFDGNFQSQSTSLNMIFMGLLQLRLQLEQ